MPIPSGPVTVATEYRPIPVTVEDLSVALDDWTGGATDSQGTMWRVTNFEGWWSSPKPRLALSNRGADHGAFDAPAYFEPRVMTLEGVAVSPNRATHLLARDIVVSVCADPAVLYPLVVTEPDRPIRRCLVRQSAEVKVADVSDRVCRWSMVLVAPDPFRYANAETAVTLTLPSGADAGLSLPFTVPFIIPMSGVGENRATVVNAGTFATRPTVVFQGPVTDPAIVNLTQGKTLAFNVTITSGQTLVVDFANRSVLLDGTVSRAYTIAYGSAWWDLQPGSNDIQYAGVGSGTALLTYRSSWL